MQFEVITVIVRYLIPAEPEKSDLCSACAVLSPPVKGSAGAKLSGWLLLHTSSIHLDSLRYQRSSCTALSPIPNQHSSPSARQISHQLKPRHKLRRLSSAFLDSTKRGESAGRKFAELLGALLRLIGELMRFRLAQRERERTRFAAEVVRRWRRPGEQRGALGNRVQLFLLLCHLLAFESSPGA